ncbi:glycosyltransferase family 2 protein [Actinosynnema pretiosum subsp. pretiosum]|uniref:Glycosyl transferase family 2 n=2 Tax=Actinosynnema TaxID=40566 RepID=C6WCS8_ACTMD|nr:glycosyltransferase [Actinosynnema mirum]ACU35695.1 glycosyl transferase family 2 [Actinosynnema mirum DSM 43827]QUF06605.1 glycosyltransferase family 2 protein [Actinosynnema pretiosum subsp. pretiosum]
MTRDPARPTVDVVIPCYNYARFLRACVRSALDQPGVDVRVLIIDDTSSDETPQVMAELMAEDPRVEGRRHEVNKGHIATYNEGLLEWAKADYTVLLSADDLLAPGSLARAAQVFRDNPKVGMVYGRVVYYQDHDDLPSIVAAPAGTTVWSGVDWIERRCRTGQNVLSSPEAVVRTSVQQAVGGYRPDLPHAGDLEMWMRIAAVSDIGYVRGAPAAYYRVHQQSMFRTQFSSVFADLEQRQAVFDRFFAEHPDLPGAGMLRALAKRSIAKDALWRAVRAYDRDKLDEIPADELAEFAEKVYGGAGNLPEHRALTRRKALGPKVCSRTQLFVGSHLAKRGMGWVGKQVWKWRGQ